MHFWSSTGKFKDGTLKYQNENISKLERSKKSSLLEQFFIVLLTLKTGLFLLDLSEKFDASTSVISKIFTLWIVFLYHDLPLHFPFEKLKKWLWLT